MKTSSVILTGIAVGLLAGSALAAPTCRVDPSRKKFYRLELTVPATFCASNQADPSCDNFPKASLIQLHGLWPNYTKGFPEGTCSPKECKESSNAKGKYCAYPDLPDLYASKPWKDLNGYMAGVEKCLERHEWVKHGTCSPLKTSQYFDWSLSRTKEISDKLALPADKPITNATFNSIVARNLPELNGAFNLTCKGNKLNTLFVLYAWESDGPGKPMKNGSGKNAISCPNKFIIPSRPN